jgi:hypothetical protein
LIDLWVPFNQPARILEQELQQSSTPKFYLDFRPNSKNTVHKLSSRVATVCDFNTTSPQMNQKLFWQERDTLDTSTFRSSGKTATFAMVQSSRQGVGWDSFGDKGPLHIM